MLRARGPLEKLVAPGLQATFGVRPRRAEALALVRAPRLRVPRVFRRFLVLRRRPRGFLRPHAALLLADLRLLRGEDGVRAPAEFVELALLLDLGGVSNAPLFLLASFDRAAKFCVGLEALERVAPLRLLERLRLLLLPLDPLEHRVPVLLIHLGLLGVPRRVHAPSLRHLRLVLGAAALRRALRLLHHLELARRPPPSRLQSPLLLPHRGHGLAARDGRERGVVALDPAARGRGARCVRIRRRRGSEQRPAAEARARMRPRRRGGGGGGDGSGEPRRADDAGDARGVLHRGHRESRGVERVHALAADPLVALPLETLVLGAQSGLGEVRHALRGEHRGVDAVLEAGADGARGGERGRGRVARVAVRDVVDGNSAEVELADGGANPRLRGARGRRGGGSEGVREGGDRNRARATRRTSQSIGRRAGRAKRASAPGGSRRRRRAWGYPRAIEAGCPGRWASRESA